MFTSSTACAATTRPGSYASSRVSTGVNFTTTWYAPTASVSNGFGHKHAARRTLS
jgi:hypothetical protein